MFYLWMKILLILIIIAIGLLVVKKNKGTAEAATASTASFVMLFAIAALYLFLVVVLQQADLLFWLVAAAIVFPFLTYVVVFASVKNAYHTAAARTTRSAASKTVRPVVTAPVARKAAKTSHRTPKKALADKPESRPSASSQSPAMPISAASVHAVEPNFQPFELDEYEFAEQTEAAEEPMPMEEEPISESQPEPLQAQQSAAPTPEAILASPIPKPLRPLFAEAAEQPATALVHMKPQQPKQVQPSSTTIETAEISTSFVEDRKQKPAFDPFADCCSKAQTLRAKGLYATAGALYERAAAMKADGADSYKALFDALSCYTKAGRTAEACAVAQHLSAHVEDLQPAETAKLSALLSYLQRRLK